MSGPVPEGTTFSVTLACNSSIINTGGGTASSVLVHFDATGAPTAPSSFTFGDPGQCTVTETVDGGAASTTYACESTAIAGSADAGTTATTETCSAAGPQDDPMTVNITTSQPAAAVTIHNTFVATPTTTTTPALKPAAAAAVVAQANFTG